MTDVPVLTVVTEGIPVVIDISPGGAVGIVMCKICGGSVDNIYNVQLNNYYANGSYKYKLTEIKCIKAD